MNRVLKALICMLLCVEITLSAAPRFAMAQSEQPEESVREVMYISSLEEFFEFAENCRLDTFSRNLTVRLRTDIDLVGSEFAGIPTFGGEFDGQGHKITGLAVTQHGSVLGLFRYVQEGAVIRDLEVSGRVTPGGTHSILGGIAGINSGTIESCVFSGKVNGADKIGGIAGQNTVTGIIDGCTVNGNIYGDHFIGGLCGENNGVIRSSENNALVNNAVEQNNIELSDVTLESLTGSESPVVTTDIGGITGTNTGVIRDCENNGAIGYQQVGYNVGGIAGSQSGYISSCVNNADIRGRKEAGGIVGQMEPSTVLRYEPDTMQILEGQLNTLSGMVDHTAGNAQGSASELIGQMSSMNSHLDNAQDALGQLLKPPADDEDSTLAALNSLSGSISAMNGVVSGMAETSHNSITTLNSDMNALVEQIGVIGQTIADSSDDMGGSITDLSDADTEEDTTGKVSDCVNNGQVSADINAGGIAGSIALENDLDPESDIQIFGNSSMNYDCEARAVILRCDNRGTVTAKRLNAGGIVGWASLGLLKESFNSGKIDAAAADYVGGIAGLSSGFIRSCSAKCTISGSSYVGGIAGTASILTGCRSMVRLEGVSEKSGSILGYSDKIFAADETEDQPVFGNYYIAVDSDRGGIDGISYYTAAEKLDDEAFYALDDLPNMFRTLTVRFIFEDGTERVITTPQGKPFNSMQIPLVPEKAGYTGHWDGLDEFDLGKVTFDKVFTLVYDPIDSVIQSVESRSNGLPVLLAQGTFDKDCHIILSVCDESPEIRDGESMIELWNFSLAHSHGDTTIRYLIPSDHSIEQIRLIVKNETGEWEERKFASEGSYIIFDVDGSEQGIGLVSVPQSYVFEIIAVSASAVLVAVFVLTFLIRKKKQQ